MKIYKIKCCKECPKIGCIHQIDIVYNYCYMQHARINNDINTLPKWCPLEEDNETD